MGISSAVSSVDKLRFARPLCFTEAEKRSKSVSSKQLRQMFTRNVTYGTTKCSFELNSVRSVLYVSMARASAAGAPTPHLLLLLSSSLTTFHGLTESVHWRGGRQKNLCNKLLEGTVVGVGRKRVFTRVWQTSHVSLPDCQRFRKLALSRSGAHSLDPEGSWRSQKRLRRLSSTTPWASSSSAAAGSSQVQNIWQTILAKLFGAFSSFVTEFRRIRVGPVTGLEILAMVRILILGCTALVAYVASKRAWAKIREHAAGKGGGEGGPMQVLARGATCLQSNMGPWSLQDFTLGLAAMAKVTEKEPPELPGKEVEDLAKDPEFLMRAQHWRALAESAYVKDSASFSLFSHLPESSIIACEWDPCQDSFRPAYVVFVDPPMGAVVLAVRGTSHVIDMLLNSGTAPEPFCDGSAHGGFVHAANVLYEQALPQLDKAFEEHSSDGGEKKKLIITGHSMGAAVGAMCGLRLREKFPSLECWAFCPPACMSLDLAKECAEFTTSFVGAHDLVPRFSLNSVENLRERISSFDWNRAEKIAREDEDWQNIKKALNTMRACQQARCDAMRTVNEKGQQMSESETGQKAKELGNQVAGSEAGEKVKEMGQQAGEQIADSDAAQKVKAMVQQANDFLQGNDCSSDGGDGGRGQYEGPMPTLYPPGKLLVLGSDPPGCGKMPEQRKDVASQRNYGTYPTFDQAKNIRWFMREAQQEELEEIVVSPWCISDHMLGNMCEAIGYFQSRCSPAMAN